MVPGDVLVGMSHPISGVMDDQGALFYVEDWLCVVVWLAEDVKENLRGFFETSEGYAEVETTVEGLSVAVLPRKGRREKAMALVLKPTGTWRGIYLRSREQLAALRSLVNNPKTEQLIGVVEELSPPASKAEQKLKI